MHKKYIVVSCVSSKPRGRKKEAKLSQKPRKEKTRGTPQDLETEASKRFKGSQEGSAAEQRARRRQERSC